MSESLRPQRIFHWLALGALIAAVAVLAAVVMRPFVAVVVWSAILAYVSWPAYRALGRMIPIRPALTAFIMTLVTAAVVIMPVATLVVLAQAELGAAYRVFSADLAQGHLWMPRALRAVPWLGDVLQGQLDRYAASPTIIGQDLRDWAQRWSGELMTAAGILGRNVAELAATLLTLFFFYRDGERAAARTISAVQRILDASLTPYLDAAGAMLRAVVFGVFVTALLQGVIAGIGYAIVGLQAPVLLGALTAAASLLPVIGTALVWAPIALWLLLSGSHWQGFALLAWGALLVHPTDNIIRPMVIGSRTHMPFLVTMFGVIGGLKAFGLMGLFVGPMILAIVTALWREWLDPRSSGEQDSEPAG